MITDADVDDRAHLFEICAELEIRLIPEDQGRKPGDTRCGRVLEGLLRKHGEEHMWLLLRTLTESENNRMALVEPVIRAISNIMIARPEWPDKGLAWLEAFDQIDLCDLWGQAKSDKGVPPQRPGIEARLSDRLREIFGEAPPRRLL